MANIAIFDRTMGMLKKVLDLRQQKQSLIAANIANADTPGYAPTRMSFEKDLQKALETPTSKNAKTHARHFAMGTSSLEGVRGKITRTPAPAGIGDENGVQVDQEMVRLSQNQILYEAAVQMFNKKLGMVKYVTKETR